MVIFDNINKHIHVFLEIKCFHASKIKVKNVVGNNTKDLSLVRVCDDLLL